MNRRLIYMGFALAILLMSVAGLSAQEEEEDALPVIFMHHSTGQGLMDGGAREGLVALGYDFWDHGYNGDRLVDADGVYVGKNWDVPGDHTDPDGWAF